ncbi:hypothetical protein GCM10011506_29440 [Marivirga lumbricoides]|uniref:Uncharacterized protein n=1 Tax=Marivirga lumbricoides TaxID=1046115 RepID=A0A2T4DIW5_9BACT|nr:hypothetical protein C9994_12760 [Marivirga lumbricoides]GGC41986.1 hypothetical protein GCM10011506_29440 [Marivirga lumbricoides]
MGIEEFKNLSLFKKIKTLYEEGEFVTSIRYYRYKVNLFLVHGYYVEAFYHPKTDRIEKIIPFDKKNSRNKFYTDQIRLPNLF